MVVGSRARIGGWLAALVTLVVVGAGCSGSSDVGSGSLVTTSSTREPVRITSPAPASEGTGGVGDAPETGDEVATSTSSTSLPLLEPNAEVLWVVDGDTIEVDFEGASETVRLIGIDTPEKTGGFRPAECFGDEASARLQELLPPGTGVYLERDEEARDRFDRLLAYVYRAPDSLFVNATLVAEGYAASYRFEPNTAYAEQLDRLEGEAIDLGLGLWGSCGGPDKEQ